MSISRRVLAALIALALLAAAAPWMMTRLASGRFEAMARQRGLVARWGGSRATFPAGVAFRDLVLTRATELDTVLSAGSLAITLDPWPLLLLRARVSRVVLSQATVRLPARAADPDTLAPEAVEAGRGAASKAAKEAAAAARARRIRSAAEQFVRVLTAPARRLPNLELRDVTLNAPSEGGEVPWSGVRVAWLELRSTPEAAALSAAGALLSEHEVPFEVTARYARDDRLTAGARIGILGKGGKLSALRLGVNGALTQERRDGVVTLHDTTRVTIGEVPMTLGARLIREGPRVTLRLAADSLDERKVKQSLPPEVLGPLLEVGIKGSWDYRLAFDLDLSRPDSVSFDADVIPHGMVLDYRRTHLPILGLDAPFTAAIHLPRERIVMRDLSPANPFYRSLWDIAPHLVLSVVTNEDGGFFRHRGFNTGAVKEAIAENLKAGAFRRGAGTITMQLVRNLYLGHQRTLSRKFREVVLAWVLENLTGLPKERMLEIYLNVIEWGPGVHGAGEAARYYFDREPGSLTLDEALFLSTIIPAPTKWRYRFDDQGTLRPFARAQMHFIGRAMIAKGWLAPDDLPDADNLKVELRGMCLQELMPAIHAQ